MKSEWAVLSDWFILSYWNTERQSRNRNTHSPSFRPKSNMCDTVAPPPPLYLRIR